MDFSHPNTALLGASGIALLGSLWLIFTVARKVVQVGLFLIAFALGFVICYGLGEVNGHPQPVWACVGEGLVFAWAWSLIRAKIARIVCGIAILAAAQAVGWLHLVPKGTNLEDVTSNAQKRLSDFQAKLEHRAPPEKTEKGRQ